MSRGLEYLFLTAIIAGAVIWSATIIGQKIASSLNNTADMIHDAS